MFAQGDAAQSGVNAHAAYAAAIDQADSSITKANLSYDRRKGLLSDDTAAQRENISALDQVASSGKAYVESLVAQGAGAAQVEKATSRVRSSFINAAEAAGLGSHAARQLADDYGLVPDEVNTEFRLFGDAINKQKTVEYQNALAALPPEVRSR